MKEKMICRGDLFYYDFGDNSGSVQSGERPVLVVQADDYNQNALTIIVAAVTSVIKKRYLPSHIILGEEFGLKKPSMVLLEQIRTVNREDLREYIGTVDDDKLFRQINATFCHCESIKKWWKALYGYHEWKLCPNTFPLQVMGCRRKGTYIICF
jgi:mRNA interferase MazF